VTEINRAREQLVHSEGRLRGLTARLESSREEERTRIARAVHDELGQLLTGLKMDLRWVEHWLEKSDDVRLRPFLDRIVGSTELTDAMIKAVQGIAADLRPGILDALGLASALDFEARRFQERTGTPCLVQHPEEMPALSADVTTSLFRIFQECLTNVARHSAATEVEVKLEPDADEIILCVADNGRGMHDIERVAVESLGLLGITERVKLLGGNVSFSSLEERGTTVVVRLPQNSQVAYGAE
jgi:signal transduction histidine kinase